MSKERQIEKIKQLLTGNRKSDRIFIFQKIVDALEANATDVLNELLRLAVSYLPNEYSDLQDEFEQYEDAYTAAFLTITVFSEITLLKRLTLMNFLVKYADYKEQKQRKEGEQLYSFDVNIQQKIFDKITGGRVKYSASDYPFSLIYFQYANLLTEYGDNANAYTMYSKAHVWNPMSGPILARILHLFKQSRQSEELIRLGQWMQTISYNPQFIALSLQFIAYGLYLDGKFEESYAFYFQSFKFDNNPYPGLNDEVNGVLRALKVDHPYNLSKVDISNLFLGKTYRPLPNETVFDVIREHLIVEYTKQNYREVLFLIDGYIKVRPRDSKITSILKKSVEALN